MSGVRDEIGALLRESLDRAFARDSGANAADVELVRELLQAFTGRIDDQERGQCTLHGFQVDGVSSGVVTYGGGSLGAVGLHVRLRTSVSRIARIRSFVASKSVALALSPLSCRIGDVELLGSSGLIGVPMRAALQLFQCDEDGNSLPFRSAHGVARYRERLADTGDER